MQAQSSTILKHTMIRIGSDSLAMFFHCLELILAIWDLRNLAIYMESKTKRI